MDHSADYDSFVSDYTYPGDTDKPYIALEDSKGVKAILYWEPAVDATQRLWHVWDIDLADFVLSMHR